MKVDWRSRTGSCGFQGGTAHGGPSLSAVLTPPGAAHGVLGPGGAGRGGEGSAEEGVGLCVNGGEAGRVWRGEDGRGGRGERGGDQREEGDEKEE